MSREHELILELRAARRTVREAEIAEQEAAVKKAERKAERMKAQATVEEILAEMDGTSDRPLIDVIHRNGETADEHQRGSTVPLPKPKRKKTERADRREVMISPNGPIRQTATAEGRMFEYYVHRWLGKDGLSGAIGTIRGANMVDAGINARKEFGETARLGEQIVGPPAAKPKRKTFAVYVRDPVDHTKAGRGLGYIDATSKDKALAAAAISSGPTDPRTGHRSRPPS